MNILTKYIYYVLFWIGVPVFKVFKFTPKWSYIGFRRLFYATKGGFNDKVSEFIASKSEKSIIMNFGLLGEFSKSHIGQIVNQIRQNGYYIFKEKMPERVIFELLQFSSKNKCKVTPMLDSDERIEYNKDDLRGTKYGYSQQDLINNETVQEVITDEIFLSIAQEYLGCNPINDTVGLWWSTSFSKEANSKVAQLFHNDMDRIKFLKFFIYVTDVSLKNGPHVYVKGSHTNIKDNINRDGRYTDDIVYEAYGQKDIIEIIGKEGTVMAVDTRGLHKGMPVKDGHRLLYSMEFCNSLFGAPYEKLEITSNQNVKLTNKFKKHSSIFRRIQLN